MFLDEELKQIREEGGHSKETSSKLIKACFNRLESPQDVGENGFLNSIKRVDASWRLFCKSYEKEYAPDGFRMVFLHKMGDLEKEVKDILGW